MAGEHRVHRIAVGVYADEGGLLHPDLPADPAADRAVAAVEREPLSADDQATFLFQAGGVHIEKPVARADFERWIAPELAAIEGAVDQAMARSGLAPDAIDRVFLTGGTSFVPAVRALFQNRFGADRIETGGEFESIAAGLALIGREADLDLWSEKAV